MNVIDINKVSYNVLDKLGEGTQGVTYLLEDKRHIVKLFSNSCDSASAKSKINFLINLGLDKRYFAVPLKQIIQPANGYITELASGMKPLSLLKYDFSKGKVAEWYIQTGGLIKRYQILIKLAALLRAIHSKGLTYCDLSPNNIFISERADYSNVFLIDLDNLRYKNSIANNIFTPFYGAPEIVNKLAPNTPMSDCYAFAVIAYELLTLNHPLIGDYVTEGEPELEEDALSGRLPWVEHSADKINERTTGLPSEKVMVKRLFGLFCKTFENGLNDIMERPTMAAWFDFLNLSLNEMLKCGNPSCGLHYPYNTQHSCTFCGYKPIKVTRIQMRRWEEVELFDKTNHTLNQKLVLEPTVYDEILLDENSPKEIAAFNFLLTEIEPLAPLLRVEYLRDKEEDKLVLTPLNGVQFYFSSRTGIPHGKKPILTDKTKIKVVSDNVTDNKKYMLHLKDLNAPQRVLTID